MAGLIIHVSDLTGFLFIKEFETRGLRCIDVKNFVRIVKKSLDLPNTVRRRDISLFIFLHHIYFQLRTSFWNYHITLQKKKIIIHFLLLFEFYRATHRFKGCLRRLIIQAKEGFHGWDEILICFLWSILPFWSLWGELPHLPYFLIHANTRDLQ